MLETELTPSEATNDLIALANRLLQGEDLVEEFGQKFSTQMAIVESELELVPARAKERGEAFLEEHGQLYEALLEHMAMYHEGLLAFAAFFDSDCSQPEHLEAGVAQLLEVTGELVGVQQIYGQVFSAYGPSRFPMINALDRLLAAFRSDPDEVEEELVHVVGLMKAQLEKNLAQDVSGVIGGEDAQRGATNAVRVLDLVQKVYTDHSTHEDLLKSLGEALFDMESGDHEMRLSMLEGPTVMPAANLFINTARRAIEGKIPKEAFMSALEGYTQFVAGNWETIESHLEKPIDSASVQEELPNTMDIVDEHDEILESLREVYEEGLDPEAFEDCVEELTNLVAVFKESAQIYIDAAGREGKIVCVSCGRGNPRANNVCESCGTVLPKIGDGEHSDSTFELSEHGGLEDETRMVMTTNLERIFKACEDIENDRIGTDEFLDVLQWAEGLLQQMSLGLAKKQAELGHVYPEGEGVPPEVENERNTIAEVMAFFEEGIDEWQAGLEEMAKFVDEPEKRHLKSGMKRVWEGASAVHRCKIIGDAANERLAQMEAGEADGAGPGDVVPEGL
jgi:hypothetical protein